MDFDNTTMICMYVRILKMGDKEDMDIRPYKQGDVGYMCMPMAKNIPEPKQGWQITKCPICSQDCYLSNDHIRIAEESKGNAKLACTECALKLGMRG